MMSSKGLQAHAATSRNCAALHCGAARTALPPTPSTCSVRRSTITAAGTRNASRRSVKQKPSRAFKGKADVPSAHEDGSAAKLAEAERELDITLKQLGEAFKEMVQVYRDTAESQRTHGLLIDRIARRKMDEGL